MQTSSVINTSPGWAAPQPAPPGTRGTSPDESRLIVRLPDLSPRPTETSAATTSAATTAAGAATDVAQSTGESRKERLLAVSEQLRARLSATCRRSLTGLPQKSLNVVRQPKFWLACVVAIAVQVVLALVVTPGEGDDRRDDRPLTAAKPWPKTPAAPAARIIVPAAPTNVTEDLGGSLPGGTTPMGPTVPLEPGLEEASPTGEPFSAEAPGDRFGPTRMVENRRQGDEAGHFDGRATAESDGATLGGIAPLEPAIDLNHSEHRQ
ncbi:MAG TPA: hypothetical protein VHC22_04035 [Pirellulales bacterium]|nr:hypothetical protein [Pirellulales bacterium]